MNKLENKSNNLKEILCAIADGKHVQYFMESHCAWWTMKPSNADFVFTDEACGYKWRIKPSAFESAWDKLIRAGKPLPNQKGIAFYFWNAALENKDHE